MDKVNEAKAAINTMIVAAAKEYHANGDKFTEAHRLNIKEIHGALRVLEIITGKQYRITETGIAEQGIDF